MRSRSPELVAWMKAAGEPSRLRLLALCAQQDMSVSDLAEALGQSEPRVSRHLRILCEAGLVNRLRQGQWVHYQLVVDTLAASFVRGMLALLDQSDPVLVRDRDRSQESREGVAGGAKTLESRLGRAMGALVDTSGSVDGAALVVGVEQLELLEAAALNSTECTAIAHSRRAAQAARAFAERRGFACRVVLAASPEGLTERDIARVGSVFESVFLNHLAVPSSAFAGMLGAGKRTLTTTGRLWIFERYEALESTRDKVVEHPLAKLRRMLTDLNLTCERISPIEADGEHVLAAVARPNGVARGNETPHLRIV